MNSYYFLLVISLFLFEDSFCKPPTQDNSGHYHYSVNHLALSHPNGLLYYQGEYHLFYQHYPDGAAKRQKAYWGHAVSNDLIHWKELGEPLSPLSLGWVTGSSGVVDTSNSAGFGSDAFILFYTQVKEGTLLSPGKKWVQNIAYSVNKGKTFTRYRNTLVFTNPPKSGVKITELRDPKVLRYPHGNQWILVMGGNDVIRFYHSKDLKSWTYKSEFGKGLIASPGGVWEHPDLFPLKYEGKEYWVLLVRMDDSKIKAGGSKNGPTSATKYFIGQFDGTKFTTNQKGPLTFDFGRDAYTSTSFHGVNDGGAIVAGWISSWIYNGNLAISKENTVGQMILPRELSLTLVGGQPRLVSKPIKEVLSFLQGDLQDEVSGIKVTGENFHELKTGGGNLLLHVMVTFTSTSNGYVCLSNGEKEELCVVYHPEANQISISRASAGSRTPGKWSPLFRRIATAGRMISDTKVTLDIYLDVSSIEVFADGGLTTMSSLHFESPPLNNLKLREVGSTGVMTVISAKVWKLHPIRRAAAPNVKGGGKSLAKSGSIRRTVSAGGSSSKGGSFSRSKSTS